MVKQIYERILELIDKYNQIGLIVEDVSIIKTKEGTSIFKTKVSAAEKFKVYDDDLKFPDHTKVNKEILEPTKVWLATRILDNMKSIITQLDDVKHEKYKGIKASLDREAVDNGWITNMSKKHGEVVAWVESNLLELGMDSAYEEYTLQELEVKGMPFGTKIIPKKEDKIDGELE